MAIEVDEQHLEEKALLLLTREQELFAMRTKHEQLTHWLRLTQLLPLLFQRALPRSEIYERLRRCLISGLGLERVMFFELAPAALRPIAPAGPDREMSAELAAFLDRGRSGLCNEPTDPEVARLAQAVNLQRFLWSQIRLEGAPAVLLLAGFDDRLARSQSPFDDGDAAHLDNVAQHMQTLLGNQTLVRALEEEKDRLQRASLALEEASGQLRSANESLERRVIERTEALAQRTRDMRLVLDNVDQGFLTIDAQGRLAQERSAIVDRWFGPFEGQPRFVDYIARVDPRFAESFAVGYEALLEDLLPRALCLEQLPARLRSEGRELRCSYSLLPGSTAVSGLLIVISDVTAQLRHAQEEAEQGELFALFQGLMRDRTGYLAFTYEAGRLIDQLVNGPFDPAIARRWLHTLKGNAAMVGANVIADLCHQAEDALDGDQPDAPRAVLERLRARWAVVTQVLMGILGDRGRQAVEIAREEVESLADQIRRGAPRSQLLRHLELWQSEPVQVPLHRLAQYARALARRLGKGELAVAVTAPELRLDPRRWGGLWSALIQVIRNAVDHGIEAPAGREARGKPPVGRLELRLRREGAALVVELEDDGQGVDWNRVAAVAAERGLPHQDHDDLVRALLRPGISTRPEVSATSGRGVGLSAVHDEVAARGGTVSVISQAGLGCCFRLSFPEALDR
jgi:two-component system chemotaxis sensor kinase CheA